MARKKRIEKEKTQNTAKNICVKKSKQKRGNEKSDATTTTKKSEKQYRKNQNKNSKAKKQLIVPQFTDCRQDNNDAVIKGKPKQQKKTKCRNIGAKKSERGENDQDKVIARKRNYGKNCKTNAKRKKNNTGRENNEEGEDEPPIKVVKQRISNCHNELSQMSGLLVEIGESKYWEKTPAVISGDQSVKSEETDQVEDDSESVSEWEDVEDLPGYSNPEQDDIKDQLPDHPVEIIVQKPNLLQKRGRCGFDINDWFRLQLNKFRRQTQINVHKVHLLCLLSVGISLNETCNDLLLQARALSLVPGTIVKDYETSEWNVNNLSQLIMWFGGEFSINEELKEDVTKLETKLQQKQVASVLELVIIFVITCRALGLQVRLIHSLHPVTFKAADLKLKTERKLSKTSETSSRSNDNSDSKASKESKTSLSSKLSSLIKKSSPKRHKANTSKRRRSQDQKSTSDDRKMSRLERKSRALPRRRCSSSVCYMEQTSEESDKDFVDLSTEQLDGHNDRKFSSSGEIDTDVVSQSSDDDFEQDDMKFRSPSSLTKKRPRSRSRSDTKKMLPDDADNSSRSDKTSDYWSEVFSEKENRWICVDCIQKEVDHPEKMEHGTSQPLCYILGYDNSGLVKDLTKRYASDYLPQMRKLRIDPDWWQDTLKCYGPKTAADRDKDKAEETQLEAKLMTQPFPKSINEFKNHPLYALKRHLLKFEALYPESAIPLGYIRGEPIYARECIHTLHSRENWLKEGKVVKIGEEPYKMVKSRKRPSIHDMGPNRKELLTAIYGLWQTEEYVPPPAVDGIVPKNEYGNVEVFKPSMLPFGTVHLKLAGLNKIAKKLDIDCAPAMVGWEQHGSFPHPLMDGFVVCEEHKDILIAAWQEEEMIRLQKEAEKKQQRVESNWKRLTKGLLLREKMKIKFNLKEPELKDSNNVEQGEEDTTKAVDVSLSWPRNRQNEQSLETKKEASVAFPFEVEQM